MNPRPVTRITIPGIPVGKGRARSTKDGRHYTPAKTRAYEDQVRMLAKLAMGRAPPHEGPVALTLDIFLRVPQSWAQWKRDAALSGAVLPTGKPDADNCAKSIMDGCNGLVWSDDAQVVSLTVTKAYATDPRVEVTAEPLPCLSANVTRRVA